MKVCLKNISKTNLKDDVEVIKDFCQLLQSDLKLKDDVYLHFTLGRGEVPMTTGVRLPHHEIFVLAKDRLLVDILRTVAHEWVHEYQHQVMGVPEDEPIQEIGGPVENMASILASVYLKKFQKQFPQHSKKLFGESLKESHSINEANTDGYDAVLVGGLDYRKSDYPINQQVELLKKGLGSDKNVKGFRYNESTSTILNFLKNHPNIPIFLFSAGATKANELSNSSYVNKNKLFVVEPFASSKKTKSIVQSAVSNGVPASNVFVGGSQSRGSGIVLGASSSGSDSHWGALAKVGGKFNKLSPITKVSDTEILNKPFVKSYKYDEEVEKLQKELVDKGYYIGDYGPNKDGIDGKYGPFTQAAHKAFLDGISPKDFKPKRIKMAREFVKNVDDVKQLEIRKELGLPIGSSENIIIGDSQVPYVDKNTSKASVISPNSGKSSLWEGGKTVSWLISALSEYPKSKDIKNVIIVIGTNGGFGKFTNDNVPLLFSILRIKFPNAKFYVVQGSWGWGGLKNIKEKDVRNYYKKFEDEGATVIEPPIGPIEPHGNKPIYSTIGSKIDSYL